MIPEEAEKVKLFAGLLYSSRDKLAKAVDHLKDCYGSVDAESREFPFRVSDYYVPEMGQPIYRAFISFEQLVGPDKLAEIKLACNEIENHLEEGGKRKVNIDPGYLDYDKIVLASAKYNGQKIYLSHGIWADLTMFYRKGKFLTYPWSFPDFKEGVYNDFFLKVRSIYKEQRNK